MTLRILSALSFCGTLLFAATAARAQETPAQPQTEQCHHKAATTDSSHASMTTRGEQGMGFSQRKTTHHFLLKPDGGIIAVSANDPKDTATRDQIRMHLAHIAHAFSEGDFDIPMFVHDQVPPGVPAMKGLSNDIQYRFKETDAGGEVVLSSRSAEAVHAIHDFLTFQIREHKTGDPVALD
jgi:hypothetical protein